MQRLWLWHQMAVSGCYTGETRGVRYVDVRGYGCVPRSDIMHAWSVSVYSVCLSIPVHVYLGGCV